MLHHQNGDNWCPSDKGGKGGGRDEMAMLPLDRERKTFGIRGGCFICTFVMDKEKNGEIEALKFLHASSSGGGGGERLKPLNSFWRSLSLSARDFVGTSPSQ